MFINIPLSKIDYDSLEKDYVRMKKENDYPDIQKLLAFIILDISKSKNESVSKRIVKMYDSGITFDAISNSLEISRYRCIELYLDELGYLSKKANLGKFQECLSAACQKLNMNESYATRAYNILCHNGVMDILEVDGRTLDIYDDSKFLKIDNFGPKMLKMCRLANDLYKRRTCL